MLVQTTACGNSTSGTVGTVDNTETMSESGTEADTEKEGDEVTALSLMQQVNTAEENVIDDNYRTYYEVFVYSFYDSDGDGIGDLKGLTENLDYINDGDPTTDTDLGCNGIWLMPVMPSTTYHKYDVTDYEAIDPEYGTMDDFTTLVDECHKRGINVIIDFVMNHTSSQHEWFQTAYKYIQSLPEGAEPDASECPYVDYYNFSKEKLGGYYPVEGTDWYYEGQFWSEMPDLNWDNEMLKTEFEQIVQFWLDLGVDGFRLDAVKEFYSGADDKNIAVLTWFNDMVKSKKEDAYLVGEAWNDYSVYAKYYQSGMDSFFDFTFADKDGIIADTVKGINGASAYGKGLVNTQELYGKPVYSSEGQIRFTVKDGYVTGYTQTYIHAADILREKKDTISQKRALMWLYQYNKLPQNSTVEWCKLGYTKLLDVNNSVVYIPTWNFCISSKASGTVQYRRINAFTGAVMDETISVK